MPNTKNNERSKLFSEKEVSELWEHLPAEGDHPQGWEDQDEVHRDIIREAAEEFARAVLARAKGKGD